MLKLFQSRLVFAFKTKTPSLKYFSTSSKDYYAVLGIQRQATLDEIKDAYRTLAKKYHPDVNTTGVFHEPDGEKFKEVAEAYAILSVSESRLSYDFLNQTTPESLYREQRTENYKKMTERGFDGQLLKQRYKKGSYAEEKFKILQEERKKFNVDAFGRYKGGLPRKEGGHKRGGALSNPGVLHEPLIHNMIINPHPDSQFVTDEDAMAFRLYQNEDKYVIQKRWLWFKAEVDYDYLKFQTHRNGLRWLRNIFFLVCGLSLSTEIYYRTANRKLKNEIFEILQHNGLQQKIQAGKESVILTKNGVLKRL